MPHNVVAAQPPAIVMTRVWMHEHDWLHSVYASHANQSPTFRFPDLLSACIELVLSRTESLARLQLFLSTELGARDPKSPRRTCHVWRRQFDELLREHRASWNSHPNPKFDLDAIAKEEHRALIALEEPAQGLARSVLSKRADFFRHGQRIGA